MLTYISTRNHKNSKKCFDDVLLDGMAPDGGLYVPEQWPTISKDALRSLSGRSYTDIAARVISPFTKDVIPDRDLRKIIEKAYGNFDHHCVTPLSQLGSNHWMMELYHGPTLAFKDVALQLLGHLFDHVLAKRGEKITIVGATSGDTGSAAIEGCKGRGNIEMFILHPHERTSEVQRRQMTTVLADNVHNIAVKGSFDDCQNAVKAMFANEKFRTETNLSAINSINWARIMAQVVYYFAASIALGAPDRPINFTVPTGNFGNVYAAYVAKQMGLPINKLIIGSNRNDILTRFITSGTMQASDVEPSISPSMDIQISSNFERFLFDVLGRDGAAVQGKMDDFKEKGSFSLDDDKMDDIRDLFSAYRCSDVKTLATMKQIFEETGIQLDPHTAVGVHATLKAMEDGLDTHIPTVSLACAHAAKFPDAVEKATGQHPELPEFLSDLYERKERFKVMKNDQDALEKFIRSKI